MFDRISKYRNGGVEKGRGRVVLTNFEVFENDVRDFLEHLDISSRSLIETKT